MYVWFGFLAGIMGLVVMIVQLVNRKKLPDWPMRRFNDRQSNWHVIVACSIACVILAILALITMPDRLWLNIAALAWLAGYCIVVIAIPFVSRYKMRRRLRRSFGS